MMKDRGFTLVELTIVVLVVSILFVALTPVYAYLVTSSKNTYSAQQTMNNQNIAMAFMSYAANSTGLGTLPSPYTGSGYTKTIYNPADVTVPGIALTQALTQSGIIPAQINDDGTAGVNVRVFQSVNGLTQQIPLNFLSGPLVILTYQYGAIYMTTCMKSTASCNPTVATGVPGISVAMSGANYTTWASTGTDLPAFFVSTLPIQKNMLTTTAQRLDKLRDVMISYLRVQQVNALAGDATNWYPADGTDSLQGASAATNQGCHDGWYSMSGSTILSTSFDLSSTEFGTTAWGGDIEYCRDYDPTNAKAANASPHSAAIRINASVSSGIAPDHVVLGNNVVLTF